MRRLLLSLLLVVVGVLNINADGVVSLVSSNTFGLFTNYATLYLGTNAAAIVINSNNIASTAANLTTVSNSAVANAASIVVNSNNLAAFTNAYNLAVKTGALTATNSASIGSATLNSSAVLDVTSTTKGILPPRMTKAQRDAITKVDGLMIYQSDNTQGLKIVVSNAWYNVNLTADP